MIKVAPVFADYCLVEIASRKEDNTNLVKAIF